MSEVSGEWPTTLGTVHSGATPRHVSLGNATLVETFLQAVPQHANVGGVGDRLPQTSCGQRRDVVPMLLRAT
jgi:hypothetical protein